MTRQILFDKVVYMDRLKRAGISEDHARAYAEAFEMALRSAVAIKADLHDAVTELTRPARTDTIHPIPWIILAMLLGAALFGFGMWVAR